MRRVPLDAGLGCPHSGCTFCDNAAFTPPYCRGTVSEQIDRGLAFLGESEVNLAYFQAFSGTNAPVSQLRELYEEALSHPKIRGLIVGTRPDCIDAGKLDLLERLASENYVEVEYGVESTSDETLSKVNRGHDFATAVRAIEQTAARGLKVGAHFILGFPGESDEFLISQTRTINSLPLHAVKFHQLQIVRGTEMARQYAADPWPLRTLDQYLDLLIEILVRLRSDIVVERIASEVPPRHLLCTPWQRTRGTELWTRLENRMKERGVVQGQQA